MDHQKKKEVFQEQLNKIVANLFSKIEQQKNTMDHQEKKEILQKQLDKIVAKEKQLQEKNQKLVAMKKTVQTNEQHTDQIQTHHILTNILTQIQYNAESLQKLRHSEAWVRRELDAIEGKGFVQNGTLRFRPFATLAMNQ